jgi:hypothetical protein
MIGGAFLGVVFSAPAISIPAFTGFNVTGSLAVGGKLPSGTPPVIFAAAVSGFLTKTGLPENVAYTIITLAISAFALTSLDSVSRAGRLAFQELFTEDLKAGQKPSGLRAVLANKYAAALLTLFAGYLLAVLGYQNIRPLFGSPRGLGPDCLRGVPEENQASREYALRADDLHVGGYLPGVYHRPKGRQTVQRRLYPGFRRPSACLRGIAPGSGHHGCRVRGTKIRRKGRQSEDGAGRGLLLIIAISF